MTRTGQIAPNGTRGGACTPPRTGGGEILRAPHCVPPLWPSKHAHKITGWHDTQETRVTKGLISGHFEVGGGVEYIYPTPVFALGRTMCRGLFETVMPGPTRQARSTCAKDVRLAASSQVGGSLRFITRTEIIVQLFYDASSQTRRSFAVFECLM